MINLCTTLLPIDRVHAIQADIDKTIKTVTVIDKVIKVDAASILIKLFTDSNTVFRVF